MSLSIKEEVIRKRKEELKEEKELERIQAKRNLDFLDIVLLARVCYFLFKLFFFSLIQIPSLSSCNFNVIQISRLTCGQSFKDNLIVMTAMSSEARTPVGTYWLWPQQ